MKLAALAFVLCAAVTHAPVAAAQFTDEGWNDAIGPGGGKREPRRLSAEALANAIAAIDSAIVKQDAVALISAVGHAGGFTNVELIPCFEKVIGLPPWPSDAANAEAHVAAQHPDRIAALSGLESFGPEREERVRVWEEWRPHGLVAATLRSAGNTAHGAFRALTVRGDDAAFEALVRCLDQDEVVANPAKLARTISALGTFERTARELDGRLLLLMLRADEVAPELLLQTELPPYATSLWRHLYLHTLPAEAVANWMVNARSRSDMTLNALAEGLMLGEERFAGDVKSTHDLTLTDTVVAASSKVGWLCAKALGEELGESFTWGDEASRIWARSLIELRPRDDEHEPLESPDESVVSNAIASIEAALADRDGEALDAALHAVLRYDAAELLDVYRRVLIATPLPADFATATESVDRYITELQAKVSSEAGRTEIAKWRPIGIEVEACRIARGRCVRVCEALVARGNEAAHDLLTDVLKSESLQANPFAHASVIDALARFEFTTVALELELCRQLGSAEQVDASFVNWTSTPYRGAPSSNAPHGHVDVDRCPRIEPHLAAARYFAERKTKSAKVIEELIDGLMFGFDSREKPTPLPAPRHSDPAVELARSVGRACRDALKANTGESFDVLSKESRTAARKWLRLLGRSRGFE